MGGVARGSGTAGVVLTMPMINSLFTLVVALAGVLACVGVLFLLITWRVRTRIGGFHD